MLAMNSDSFLQFPCDFPIKAMGRSDDDFPPLIAAIVSRHAPDWDPSRLTVQSSCNGRFQSVTITIQAQSREQLDAIYHDLSAHRQVMVAL
jgi:putative lipoic acid-binding regulatory protein